MQNKTKISKEDKTAKINDQVGRSREADHRVTFE